MRHGRYVGGLLLALVAGVVLGVWALVFGPEWTCKHDVACDHQYPSWCTPYYAALAFGPAVLVLFRWYRAWKRSAVKLALVILVFAANVAHAQAPFVPPPIGARVRITLRPPANQRVIGRYEGMQDSLLLLVGARAIPSADILHVELSRGRRASVAGGIAGVLLGAAAGGFVLGCLANRDSYGVLCGGQDDTKVVVGAVLGGAAGGALGALLFRGERWTRLTGTP